MMEVHKKERVDHNKEISDMMEVHKKEISNMMEVHKKEIFEWRSKVRHLKDKISEIQVSDHSTDSESDTKMKDVEEGSE
jgi:hypothetical protein